MIPRLRIIYARHELAYSKARYVTIYPSWEMYHPFVRYELQDTGVSLLNSRIPWVAEMECPWPRDVESGYMDEEDQLNILPNAERLT